MFVPICDTRFYPRAREGRDIAQENLARAKICFYPRAREGRDAYRRDDERPYVVSIRAPVKDATCKCGFVADSIKFLSARP